MSCVLKGVVPLGLVLLVCGAQGFFLPNVTHLEKLLSKYQQDRPHSRVRRAIPRADKEEIDHPGSCMDNRWEEWKAVRR